MKTEYSQQLQIQETSNDGHASVLKPTMSYTSNTKKTTTTTTKSSSLDITNSFVKLLLTYQCRYEEACLGRVKIKSFLFPCQPLLSVFSSPPPPHPFSFLSPSVHKCQILIVCHHKLLHPPPIPPPFKTRKQYTSYLLSSPILHSPMHCFQLRKH